MRSESELANFDVLGTQRAIAQPEIPVMESRRQDATHARVGLAVPAKSSTPQSANDGPGAELAEEAGHALRLLELLKARDSAMALVTAEWEVAFEAETDDAVQGEGRLAHESIRARLDELSRIDPSELPEGSVPPTSKSREAALSVVDALYHGRGILFQRVALLPDSGFELEFESSNLYVGLWVYDRNHIDILVQKGVIEKSLKIRIDQIMDVVWEQLG